MHEASQRATTDPPKDPIVSDIKQLWAAGRTLPQIASQLHLSDGFVRCVLQTGDVPNAATDLIETIMILHSICVPAGEISRRLKIDQATTLHVIEHGVLPQRQLPLLWSDEPQKQLTGFCDPIPDTSTLAGLLDAIQADWVAGKSLSDIAAVRQMKDSDVLHVLRTGELPDCEVQS